jgi:hypothetical protein
VSNVPQLPSAAVPAINNGPRDATVAASYAPITTEGTGYFVANGLATTTSGSGTGLTIDITKVSGGGGLTYTGYRINTWGSGY